MNEKTIAAAIKLMAALDAFDYAVRAEENGKEIRKYTEGLLPSLDAVRQAAIGISEHEAKPARKKPIAIGWASRREGISEK